MEFLFSAFLALLSKPLGISEARYTSHECLSSENMLLVFFYPETVNQTAKKFRFWLCVNNNLNLYHATSHFLHLLTTSENFVMKFHSILRSKR